jgi:hypothetical protein
MGFLANGGRLCASAQKPQGKNDQEKGGSIHVLHPKMRDSLGKPKEHLAQFHQDGEPDKRNNWSVENPASNFQRKY